MARMTADEAVETYMNGNISDFKMWIRTSTRREMIDLASVWFEAGMTIDSLKSYVPYPERRRR